MKTFAVSLLLVPMLLGCSTSQHHNSSSIPATYRNPPVLSRPLYGKDSLSDEEKRFLYKPFYPNSELRVIENKRKVRPIAMICMKHRLNRNEIIKLLAMPIDHESDAPDGTTGICYHFAVSGSLCFDFDTKGNLMRISGFNGVPSLESVTPDTPIELPPSPY